MKKICPLIMSHIAILFIVVLVCASAISADYDFTVQPPLGQEIDLVSGLNQNAITKSIENYTKGEKSELEELRIIAINLQNHFDPEQYGKDIFGGCYLADTSTNPQLFVLLTDLNAAPEIENTRVHFRRAKYTQKQLYSFREIVSEYYLNQGLLEIGGTVKSNKIRIVFECGTDISKLDQLIPADSYTYSFELDEKIEYTSSTAIQNGAKIYEGTNSTEYGSIGLPITWGNGNYGWLTAGHVLKNNGASVTY